ncbi:major antigen-like [Drosophila subobscura]|uniref:major antigen-like n=1 Tax=Drosophila subobscura TaxID=7241 RepID=UPI00155A8C58|nr:major antigen-like [Drosophila subobscura]
MEPELQSSCMFSCESYESINLHSDLAKESDGCECGSSQSNSATQSDGNTSNMLSVPTDSGSSIDIPLKGLEDGKFVEHFKKDPKGFLDEIVERYVQLNKLVKQRNKMTDQAVAQSKNDRQLLLEEQKLNSDLRLELEDCKKRAESASVDCRNLAKHNGICTVIQNELLQCQKICAGLTAEKEQLMEELNFYKSQALDAMTEGGGDGCGSPQKYQILNKALKNQLELSQGIILELEKRNEELESTDATLQELQKELSFYKKRYFEDNAEELVENKKLQEALTRMQTSFKTLEVANERLSSEMEVYKEMFFQDESKGDKKVKTLCLSLQSELEESKKTIDNFRAKNDKLNEEVADMKLMLNRVDLQAKGLKFTLDMNAELEDRAAEHDRAIVLLQRNNSHLRQKAAKRRMSYRKLQETLTLELAKQQALSCSGGPDGDLNHGNAGKHNSLAMRLMRHFEMVTATPVSNHSRTSSTVSLSQIIGRDHLKMDPEEVLEEVYKTFCGLTYNYWIREAHADSQPSFIER